MFMKYQIFGPLKVVAVETKEGRFVMPFDDFDFDDWKDDVESFEVSPCQYIGRLSAPGYLDCTDWIDGQTTGHVAAYLVEHFFDAVFDADDELDEEQKTARAELVALARTEFPNFE